MAGEDLQEKFGCLHMEIRDNHAEIKTALVELNLKMSSIGKDVTDHGHTLYGNGKDGIVIEVDRLKQFKTHLMVLYGIVMSIGGHIIYSLIMGT